MAYIYYSILGITLVLLAAQITDVKAISCFKCNGVAFPRDCPFVTQCGPHEECFVDQIVSSDGNIKYNSGCRDKQNCIFNGRKRDTQKRQGVTGDFTACTDCCNKDHCNYGGCGEPGLPDRSTRGPICFDCYQQRQEDGCNQVKICGQDNECHIMRAPSAHFDFAYTTGCITKSRCSVLSILGKRDAENENDVDRQTRSGICFHCCNDDLCNRYCSGNQTQSTTSKSPSTTQSTTSSITQPTTSSTTSRYIPITNSATQTKVTAKPSTSSLTTTQPVRKTSLPRQTTTPPATSQPTAMSSSTTQSATMSSNTPSMSTVTSTQMTTTVKANCPTDTTRYLRHCYYFSTDIKYWEESRQLCLGRKGYLLKIEDMNEQLFIEKKLRELNSAGNIPSSVWGYYMGAHLVQGTWEWTDGTPVTFTDWGRDEPDHPDFQTFGLIFIPGHYTGEYKWGSHSDMQGTSRYICEIELH